MSNGELLWEEDSRLCHLDTKGNQFPQGSYVVMLAWAGRVYLEILDTKVMRQPHLRPHIHVLQSLLFNQHLHLLCGAVFGGLGPVVAPQHNIDDPP